MPLESNSDIVVGRNTGLLPRADPKAIEKAYALEELLEEHIYTGTFSGIDFPTIFEKYDFTGKDAVVRFDLGCTYTSTTQLRLQLYAPALSTTHWYRMDGFQQSTSAISGSASGITYIDMCQGVAQSSFAGSLIFPGCMHDNTHQNTSYPLGVRWFVETASYSTGYTKTWGYGGAASTPAGTKIAGFRLYESVFGNGTYQIGKPGWMQQDAYIRVYSRPRSVER